MQMPLRGDGICILPLMGLPFNTIGCLLTSSVCQSTHSDQRRNDDMLAEVEHSANLPCLKT